MFSFKNSPKWKTGLKKGFQAWKKIFWHFRTKNFFILVQNLLTFWNFLVAHNKIFKNKRLFLKSNVSVLRNQNFMFIYLTYYLLPYTFRSVFLDSYFISKIGIGKPTFKICQKTENSHSSGFAYHLSPSSVSAYGNLVLMILDCTSVIMCRQVWCLDEHQFRPLQEFLTSKTQRSQ